MDESKESCTALEAQLEEAVRIREELAEALQALRENHAALEEEVAESKEAYTALEEKLAIASDENRSLQEQLEVVLSERTDLAAQVDAKEALFARLADEKAALVEELRQSRLLVGSLRRELEGLQALVRLAQEREALALEEYGVVALVKSWCTPKFLSTLGIVGFLAYDAFIGSLSTDTVSLGVDFVYSDGHVIHNTTTTVMSYFLGAPIS